MYDYTAVKNQPSDLMTTSYIVYSPHEVISNSRKSIHPDDRARLNFCACRGLHLIIYCMSWTTGCDGHVSV